MNQDLPDDARATDVSRFQLGDAASFCWLVEVSELEDFARISGDRNPLHMSEEFARTKGFAGRVAHGFLLGCKVSALVGMLLPGRDCLILEQSLSFPKAIYPGDQILLEGSVSEISVEQKVLKIKVRASRVSDDASQTVARGYVLCRNQ